MLNKVLEHQYIVLQTLAIIVNIYARNLRNRILIFLLSLTLVAALFTVMRIDFKCVFKHFIFPLLLSVTLYSQVERLGSANVYILFLRISGDLIPLLYCFLGYRLIRDNKKTSSYVARRKFVAFYVISNIYILSISLVSLMSLSYYTSIKIIQNTISLFPNFFYDNLMYPLWTIFCIALSLYSISEAWWIRRFFVRDALVFNQEKLDEISKNIENNIESKKPYLDCNLNKKEYSKLINISSDIIDVYVSHKNFKNFTHLLNFYRVEEFKRKVKFENNTNYTLIGIATECGFKSKSTFFRVFKEFEGKTPKMFVDKIISDALYH